MAIDSSPTGLRILAVDDDQQFLTALEQWLTSYDDADVITATNGAEALESIDETVNVLVCDRQMPEMTGDEVIERLKHEQYDVLTVVISAYTPDSALREDEADLYLQKPIDRQEVLTAIDQLLSH